MKPILTFIFVVAWSTPELFAQQSSRDSLSVTIFLKNKDISVDSVLIIFDRYDLTGAGVIKQVFYPSNNKVIINKVPKGKYYVDVFCIGADHQNISQVRTIGRRRSNKLSVPVETFETYAPGSAVIPPSSVDFANLVVTQKKYYR